jgi:hypothetical protein
MYDVGRPGIIFPIEINSTEAESMYDFISKEMMLPTNSDELQASISRNATIIAAMVMGLQPNCPSISRRFQIGIHSNGQIGISDMIDIKEDGTFNFDIKFESIS